MFDNLNKLNVSDEALDFISKNLNPDILASLSFNYDIINKNIELLSSYGIENMDKLFINKYDVLMLKTEDLVKRLSKFNIPVLIQLINEDVNVIDDIL